ncbi:MarR family winged helix-turn-helix transcriptional regulator [Sphingomonas profundi]|uniref:MarR family winged helix-turn-helix transcriptional regulator n=1 Tax=Alterirhizorhabdus profundi TaxID=2681549 RepID=UPI0012E8C8AB|nr:MarR family transcriptional regulator [Sphingomonas profundi]
MSEPALRSSTATRVKPFRLGFLVHDVSRLRRRVVDKALKPLGVTRSQWWVLANLSRHEGGSMMQSELANVLDMSKVALGDLLDRLGENGFVVREADPYDKRVRRVRLSRAGEALLSTIQERAEALNRQMLQDYGEDEIRMVEDVLHGLKQRLLQMSEEQRAEPPFQVIG